MTAIKSHRQSERRRGENDHGDQSRRRHRPLRHKRTLLIDLDPQANSSITFFDMADVHGVDV